MLLGTLDSDDMGHPVFLRHGLNRRQMIIMTLRHCYCPNLPGNQSLLSSSASNSTAVALSGSSSSARPSN